MRAILACAVALASPSAALKLPACAPNRRALLLFGAAALCAPQAASASYAMTQAAQKSSEKRAKEGWKPVATSDKATLEALQDAIDEKRRFRPDESELGGLSYTKRSADRRYEEGGIDAMPTATGKSSKYDSIPTVDMKYNNF